MASWCGSLWDILALKFWNNWKPGNLIWPSGVCTEQRKHHPFLFEDGSDCKDAHVGRRRVEDLALIFQKPHK